jgi:hypothetical protein
MPSLPFGVSPALYVMGETQPTQRLVLLLLDLAGTVLYVKHSWSPAPRTF